MIQSGINKLINQKYTYNQLNQWEHKWYALQGRALHIKHSYPFKIVLKKGLKE